MKERPILFSAPMVRAMLAGMKTQTRRVFADRDVNGDELHTPAAMQASASREGRWFFCARKSGHVYGVDCPYGKPGDRLWVRETWGNTGAGVWTVADARSGLGGGKTVYRADGERPGCGWFPSIHMPREFSRLLLEITDVRVQRLQGISEADAIAEGCSVELLPSLRVPRDSPMAKKPMIFCGMRDVYAALWESINGAGSWDANPWVWAITFKRVQP